MNTELEKLRSIIYSGDYDEESKAEVRRLEERYQRAIADQKLLTIPAVQDYVVYLEQEIERCKQSLAERTLELTERQRIQLHERKEACRDFLKYFKPASKVETEIKHYLDLNAPKAESDFS